MIEIVAATAHHCGVLADNIRWQDFLEVERLGLSPDEAVRQSFEAAAIARTALVDGAVAAMWGVTPIVPRKIGRPWLLTTDVCDKVNPGQFVGIYRNEVREFSRMYDCLENHVDATYDAAIKLIELAGFTVDEPVPFGIDGALFRRFFLDRV